jgi:carboxylesterase type B
MLILAEYPRHLPFKTDTVLQAQFQNLLQTSACRNLDCLRALPADVLANTTQQADILGLDEGRYGHGDYYYTPSIDGKIIQDLPSVAYNQGRFAKVPLLTDHTTYEGNSC